MNILYEVPVPMHVQCVFLPIIIIIISSLNRVCVRVNKLRDGCINMYIHV